MYRPGPRSGFHYTGVRENWVEINHTRPRCVSEKPLPGQRINVVFFRSMYAVTASTDDMKEVGKTFVHLRLKMRSEATGEANHVTLGESCALAMLEEEITPSRVHEIGYRGRYR